MKRIEENSASSSFLTKNITSLVFAGLILLLIPFFILFTQSPEEKGFEYRQSWGSWNESDALTIHVSDSGFYYVNGKPTTEGDMGVSIDEKLSSGKFNDRKPQIVIVMKENTKIAHLSHLMDYFSREFGDKVRVAVSETR